MTQQYIALLRGINVGGNNTIAMSRLRATFEACGYQAVHTYGNVGNVCFETSDEQETIVWHIEQSLLRDFNCAIRVIVKTAAEIIAITAAIPAHWSNDTDTKTDILFLWPKYDYPEVAALLHPKPEVDAVIYVSGALLWSAKRSKISQSGIRSIFGTDLYKHVTIRNVNTVRKLAQNVASYSHPKHNDHIASNDHVR